MKPFLQGCGPLILLIAGFGLLMWCFNGDVPRVAGLAAGGFSACVFLILALFRS